MSSNQFEQRDILAGQEDHGCAGDPHNATVLYHFMLSRYWEERISWQHNPDSGEEQGAWHTGYMDVVIVPSSWLTAVDSEAIATNLEAMKIL